MNNIKLRTVSIADAHFLYSIMNMDTILNVLNEVPTQLEDWIDAVKAWDKDDDEEDYMICDRENPVGWIGINGLSASDKVVYLKLIAILPDYHNKGIGHYAINEVIEMLKERNYGKILLYTDEDNVKARSCYRKCGFKITGALTEKMSNGKAVARYIMELIL